jgi:hypothetical protein
MGMFFNVDLRPNHYLETFCHISDAPFISLQTESPTFKIFNSYFEGINTVASQISPPSPPSKSLSTQDIEKNHKLAVKEVMNFLFYNFAGRSMYDNDVRTTIKTMQRVASCRVKEGQYINQTLAEARNAISEIVRYKTRKNLKMMPLVIDACDSQLCSKYLGGDCYDTDPYVSTTANIRESEAFIHLQEAKVDFDELKLVVFGVFDNSPRTDDTPVQVYIPINELVDEYDRVTARRKFIGEMNTRFKRVALQFEKDEGYNNEISDSETGKLDLNVNAVNRYYKWVKYYEKIIPVAMYTLLSDACTALLKSPKSVNIEVLRNLINTQVNLNRASPIGSLEFLDMVAKNAIKGPESDIPRISTCVIPKRGNITLLVHDTIPNYKELFEPNAEFMAELRALDAQIAEAEAREAEAEAREAQR